MDYVSPAGTNQIKKWSKKILTIQELSDLETLLGVLAKTKQWGMPDFRRLSGKNLAGLGEIRWKSAQGTPLRIIGTAGTTAGQYVLLVGCSHKGTVYNPPEALNTAIQRKKDLLNKTGSTCEHEEDDGEAEEEQAP